MLVMKQNQFSSLDQLTKQSVRAFWLDGLWDLAVAGMLLLIAIWGYYYTIFAAFPRWTWPFFQESGKNTIWIGLILLVLGLTAYFWLMWMLVKELKHRLIYPHTGIAEHRFFLPMDRKVYFWYGILYLSGLGMLYGFFFWIQGGFRVMSIAFIISPAAILFAIGWLYRINRYVWIAGIGFTLALTLELLATSPANYSLGPVNFLDTLPAWGCPTLPCLVWAGMFLISGLAGLLNVRRRARESRSAV